MEKLIEYFDRCRQTLGYLSFAYEKKLDLGQLGNLCCADLEQTRTNASGRVNKVS